MDAKTLPAIAGTRAERIVIDFRRCAAVATTVPASAGEKWRLDWRVSDRRNRQAHRAVEITGRTAGPRRRFQ